MVSVGDVRLFVDIDGAKLVPDGDSMRERPTIVMLHGNGREHDAGQRQEPLRRFSVQPARLELALHDAQVARERQMSRGRQVALPRDRRALSDSGSLLPGSETRRQAAA